VSDPAAEYYDHPRHDLLDLFPMIAARILDIGCGSGATGAAAKSRWPGVETIGVAHVAHVAQRAAARHNSAINVSAET
jgi:trans-aconitate methyltransferase